MDEKQRLEKRLPGFHASLQKLIQQSPYRTGGIIDHQTDLRHSCLSY